MHACSTYSEQPIKLTKGEFHYKMRVIQNRNNKSKGMNYELINRVGECKGTVKPNDSKSTYTVTRLLKGCKLRPKL